jgi:polar amino acid transport system ATP-binding protein
MSKRTAGTPIVRFASVVKRFGPLTVLDRFDFTARKGEKVTLIGPSGSGKSTVLRILMTLEPVQEGTVEVDGLSYHEPGGTGPFHASDRHLREIRSHVGMVFQSFNLFPHMNVLRNLIEAPMAVLRLPKKDAVERALGLLEMVGLADKRLSFPGQLSGGQQQRVALARALALRPSVRLVDEPTSALDPELVGEVQGVIRKVAHEHDLTMILVTHEMRFAREISDRVCFFDKGRIIEEGSPAEILVQPRERRTRMFLRSVLGYDEEETP